MSRILTATALLFGALVPASAFAQAIDGGGERVNVVIVYGNDTCPASTGEEIVVCPRKAESERYRIPEMFRASETPDNEPWTNRVESYEMVGRSGTLSCSPVGAGGATGCLAQMINTAYAERGLQPDVRFAELIAAERARRLSTIDDTAAEEQSRVESLERQYEERRLREEAAASGAPTPDEAQGQSPPPPAPNN